jgi:membrane-associated phospholipid phosphatase
MKPGPPVTRITNPFYHEARLKKENAVSNVNKPFSVSLSRLKRLQLDFNRQNMETVNTISPAIRMVRIPARWYLAKTISILSSPPLLWLIAIAMIGNRLNSPLTWMWSGIYGVASIGAPIAYLGFLLRTGQVDDFHMADRAQRIRPMRAFLLFFLLSWLIFLASGAPYLFQILALVGTLQAAVMLLITMRWKISGHGAGAAGFSVLLWGLNGSAAAPALIFIPIVLWARVYLSRHTLAQSIVGALAGAVFMLIVLALMALKCPTTGLICA